MLIAGAACPNRPQRESSANCAGPGFCFPRSKAFASAISQLSVRFPSVERPLSSVGCDGLGSIAGLEEEPPSSGWRPPGYSFATDSFNPSDPSGIGELDTKRSEILLTGGRTLVSGSRPCLKVATLKASTELPQILYHARPSSQVRVRAQYEDCQGSAPHHSRYTLADSGQADQINAG